MNKRPTSTIHRPGERGVALILTLSILALVTLLLIAFVTSMRVENAASKNFNEVIKARELARGAIDKAVAQIRLATPQRIPGGATYVTFPGGTYVNSGTLPGTLYPLYSDPTLGDPTNLNSGLWITGGTNGSGEFAANTGTINVGWMYVAQDGTIGPPSVAVGHGPLVGRFAYWVDDEASKINVNTAGAPPFGCADPLSVCSASNDVDLTMLLPSSFSGFSSIPTATHPYTTIGEIKRAPTGGMPADIFDDDQFEVTAYSDDANYPNYADDLDVFDRQRVPLTPNTLNTAVNIAGPGDGAYARLSASALMQVCAAGGATAAFAAKYTPSGLSQIIANIIGYQIDPTAIAPPDGGGTPPTYLGLARTPYINEVQVKYVTSGTALTGYTVTRTVSVELCFIYSGTYNAAGETIVLNNLPTAGGLFSAGPITLTVPSGLITGPNAYVVPPPYTDPPVQIATAVTIPAQATPTQVTYSRSYRLHYAQMALPLVTLSLPVQGAVTVYQDAEANDPAVGPWTTSTTIGTLGAQNNAYSQTSDPTLGVKAVPSKAIMRAGPMVSVGELGYIHTANAWQYLTLQPGGNTTAGQIPDWAMLDLFTVGAGTGGRININSLINAGAPQPTAQRLVPLEALLHSVGLAANAQDIYTDGTSVRTDTYGMKQTTGAGVFDTIGEVCEIPSLANGATTQAGKEATIRRIGNIITTRSNAFTIWVLAQSIKQSPNTPIPGMYNPTYDVITGDVKAQAVVERYESTPGTSAPEFRTRYFRYLYN